MPEPLVTQAEIAELRRTLTSHERELGTLSVGQDTLKEDVNALADEVRKSRHEMRTQMTTLENRLIKEVAHSNDETREQLERMRSAWRFFLVIAVPAATAVLGVVVGRTG